MPTSTRNRPSKVCKCSDSTQSHASIRANLDSSDPLTYAGKGQKRTIFVPHHAAVFACARPTNLYFPEGLGFSGNLVGGPLSGIFRHGVRDVPVDSAEWGAWLRHTPGIHTHYWSKNTLPQEPQVAPKAWVIEALRKALDLESRTWLHEVEPTSEPNQP